MKVEIDKIAVGLPVFQWLLGRLTDEEFKEKDELVWKLIVEEKGFNRETYLQSLYHQYQNYLDLPILVEQVVNEEYEVHYMIKDGRRRLSVLNYLGRKKVEAEFWQEGWGKKEWEESRLLQMLADKELVAYPQKRFLQGYPPFHLWIDRAIDPIQVDSWLVSTTHQVPFILDSLDTTQARGSDFNRSWTPRIEVLLGRGKHHVIAREFGTQPLNSYLVGHFAAGPNAEKDPLVQRYGRFVRVQQYFKAGYYGKGPPGWEHEGKHMVREQLKQNNIGFTMLRKMNLIEENTLVYFSDQSVDKPGRLEDYFKLFKVGDGVSCLKEYYVWLANYFQTCRPNDFEDLEGVLKCLRES